MKERFGATNPKALALRFHAQTGGSTLTAQQPENNIVRVALQAFAAVCGGTQSLHTNGFDEALALPTRALGAIALRTQQVIAHEAGARDTADPLGGSYFIEELTDRWSGRGALIERVDEFGGAVAAIEAGFVQDEIEQSAFEWQQEVESGERVIVGVNKYVDRRASTRSCCASIPRRSGVSSNGPRASAPSGTRRKPSARLPPCVRRRSATRTCCLPCATRCARCARSARSARPCASSGACTTAFGRGLNRTPGPEGSGAVFKSSQLFDEFAQVGDVREEDARGIDERRRLGSSDVPVTAPRPILGPRRALRPRGSVRCTGTHRAGGLPT